MAIIPVTRHLGDKKFRVEVVDIRAQRRSCVTTFEIPEFSAGGRVSQRRRFLMRQKAVVDTGRRVLIVEYGGAGGHAEGGRYLMPPAYTGFLIVVEARAEVRASARSVLKIEVDPGVLHGVPGDAREGDIRPDLTLLEAGESGERKSSVARISPDIAIAAAQCDLARQIVDDV